MAVFRSEKEASWLNQKVLDLEAKDISLIHEFATRDENLDKSFTSIILRSYAYTTCTLHD